jgi:hypothetical protein
MARDPVPASEFTRNFGRYRMLAQREPIPVSSHGGITGYFVRPDEFEEFLRFRDRRKAVRVEDLTAEQIAAIEATRMDARHDPLDALLDP